MINVAIITLSSPEAVIVSPPVMQGLLSIPTPQLLAMCNVFLLWNTVGHNTQIGRGKG